MPASPKPSSASSLACGAVAVLRAARRARVVAVVTIGFAVVGFLVGLNMTARGGDPADVTYHVVMLPVLVATVFLAIRAPRRSVAADPGYELPARPAPSRKS